MRNAHATAAGRGKLGLTWLPAVELVRHHAELEGSVQFLTTSQALVDRSRPGARHHSLVAPFDEAWH